MVSNTDLLPFLVTPPKFSNLLFMTIFIIFKHREIILGMFSENTALQQMLLPVLTHSCSLCVCKI
jgi:hypothetical protein